MREPLQPRSPARPADRAKLTTAPQAPPPCRPASPAQTILLLGLGNDILRDDAVGLQIVRGVRQQLSGFPQISFLESSEMGLALLDYIVGVGELFVVDAIQTRQAPPGFLHEISLGDLRSRALAAPHFLGIGEVLALARQLDLPVPERVHLLAVEVEDPFTVSMELSKNLQAQLFDLIEHVSLRLEHAVELRQGAATAARKRRQHSARSRA